MEQKTGLMSRIGCWVYIILAGMIFASMFYLIGILPLRLNPGYVQGMKIIKSDPAVAELFGSPVWLSPIIWGHTDQTNRGYGTGFVNTHLYGPKNNGEAYFNLRKNKGESWFVWRMDIDIDDEEVLTWDSSGVFAGKTPFPTSPAQSTMAAPTPVPGIAPTATNVQ